ncbi:hypothetical protein V8E36_002797 [Tilletia maclaganii]
MAIGASNNQLQYPPTQPSSSSTVTAEPEVYNNTSLNEELQQLLGHEGIRVIRQIQQGQYSPDLLPVIDYTDSAAQDPPTQEEQATKPSSPSTTTHTPSETQVDSGLTTSTVRLLPIDHEILQEFGHLSRSPSFHNLARAVDDSTLARQSPSSPEPSNTGVPPSPNRPAQASNQHAGVYNGGLLRQLQYYYQEFQRLGPQLAALTENYEQFNNRLNCQDATLRCLVREASNAVAAVQDLSTASQGILIETTLRGLTILDRDIPSTAEPRTALGSQYQIE